MLINSDNIPTVVIPVISIGEEMWRIGTKTLMEKKKIRNQTWSELLGVYDHGNSLIFFPLVEPQRAGKRGAQEYQLDPKGSGSVVCLSACLTSRVWLIASLVHRVIKLVPKYSVPRSSSLQAYSAYCAWESGESESRFWLEFGKELERAGSAPRSHIWIAMEKLLLLAERCK